MVLYKFFLIGLVNYERSLFIELVGQ